MAGGDNSVTNVINFITIATQGNAIDFGDLLSGTFEFSATASQLRGIWGGGLSPNDTTKIDTIQYVEILTTGNAVDFGNLLAATQEPAATSNAHGGL